MSLFDNILMPNICQALGVEIYLIVEMGYIWVQAGRNRKTPTLSAFFRLCSALMLFLLDDIPVRISDLHLCVYPAWVTYILNAFFIGFQALIIYEWFVYFLTVQESKLLSSPLRLFIARIPLLVMGILLIVSYWTGWLFYIDDAGEYARGSLFALQFLIPYSYLITSFVCSVVARKRNKERNNRSFFIFLSASITALITSILQIIFSGSFTHAGLCLAVTLVYIEMYREELKQMDQMKSLAVVNEQLAKANDNLNRTIHDLEISVANEQAASNAKNEFLSRMSHDIRTPLNGILGIINIDDKHPDDIQLLTENRKKAKTAATHLASLVNDVLDMSKLSSGSTELAHEAFLMPDLVSDVFTIVQARAANAGITLVDENTGDDFRYPATYGSPLHISRIFINIIGNGIKYNKENGSVSLKLEHESVDDSHIRYIVTISDTGIGMSDEFIEKLFDPFAQEHTDARSVYEGSGLGMTITKALVEKMGGSLTVESQVGVGSKFIVSLVFEIAPDSELPVDLEDDDQALDGVRILMAEDNALNTEIALAIFEDSGAKIDVANNGKVAVEKFAAAPEGTYDLILMDCMMPVMDGYEATRAIRELDRPDARRIPILAMTANAFSDDVRKCLDAGMDDHIAKPIDTVKAIKTIRKHV